MLEIIIEIQKLSITKNHPNTNIYKPNTDNELHDKSFRRDMALKHFAHV